MSISRFTYFWWYLQVTRFRARLARSRWGRLGLTLTLCLVLAACGTARIPTQTDFSTPESMATWGCEFVGGIMPILFVVAMVFGMIGVLLYGVAKFGAGVVPGGFLSWTQQNMTNLISGILILAVAPIVVVSIFAALMTGIGTTLTCVIGAG